MPPLVTSIRIQAPPTAVWEELATLEQHAEWMADAESIEFRTASTRGTGTAMAVRTRVGPLTTCDEITVTWWAPHVGIGVSHRGIVSGIGAFALAPDADGTILVWYEDLRFPARLGGALGAFVARPVLRRIWEGNLRRFASRFATSTP